MTSPQLTSQFTTQLAGQSARKRPVNLTLNEQLVAQAKSFTDNLSATIESLLADYVLEQRQRAWAQQQWADSCAQDWNAVHEKLGSFADEHSTL